jgi:hypothetical protein
MAREAPDRADFVVRVAYLRECVASEQKRQGGVTRPTLASARFCRWAEVASCGTKKPPLQTYRPYFGIRNLHYDPLDP